MCLPITTVGMFGATTRMAKHAVIRPRLSRERTKSLTQGESPSLFETNRFTSGRTTIKIISCAKALKETKRLALAIGIAYLVDRYCSKTLSDWREKSTTRKVKTVH